MATQKPNIDYLLGKLDAMAVEGRTQQAALMAAIVDIKVHTEKMKDEFVAHTQDDLVSFGKVHARLAESTGRVKGMLAVGGVAVTIVVTLVTYLMHHFGG